MARIAGPRTAATTGRASAERAPVDADARGMPRLSIRIDLGSGARIGPGKIVLLEEIGRTGSISAAGRALKMSYRRAWELVEDLNRNLGISVVATAAGGPGGGGARLTEAGHTVIAAYRAVEEAAHESGRVPLGTLSRLGRNDT